MAETPMAEVPVAVISELLAERSAGDVPGVKLVGLVVGILLLIAAIRAMFGGRRR